MAAGGIQSIGVEEAVANLPDFSKLVPVLTDLRLAEPSFPRIEIPPNPLITNVQANLASEFYERLVKWVNDFDKSLDQEHEVGVRLVTFGQTVIFHLEDIGYWNPSLILFQGTTEDGNPVELIQHVSQISILLTKLPRKDAETPKRPIGFHEAGEEPR